MIEERARVAILLGLNTMPHGTTAGAIGWQFLNGRYDASKTGKILGQMVKDGLLCTEQRPSRGILDGMTTYYLLTSQGRLVAQTEKVRPL